MTLPKSAQKRPYFAHGHHALTKALKAVGNHDGWVERLGEVGEALQAWKAALVEDLGGDSAVSAMERSVIELATKTHLLLASVDRFLLEQKSLINKSKRQLFPIVLQRQQLADALARYMGQLGLKRRAKPTTTLAEYLAKKGHERSTSPRTRGRTPASEMTGPPHPP